MNKTEDRLSNSTITISIYEHNIFKRQNNQSMNILKTIKVSVNIYLFKATDLAMTTEEQFQAAVNVIRNLPKNVVELSNAIFEQYT
ncbi:hypothetical protein E2986_12446 [Frieseomelitta varia]|uniref:Uncharacterized protein n=1 Tax=Frieseomelitta varia TaxID=561572 RepID=A0A833SFR3_9HYME|nr:hypothetical protein E2986_12446 [Frieseomelitta varia]